MFEALGVDLVIAVVAMAQALFALDRREATGIRRVVAEFRVVLGLLGLGVLVSLIAAVTPSWAPVPIQVVLASGIAIWFNLPAEKPGLGIVSTAVFSVGIALGYGGYVHGHVRVIDPSAIVQLEPSQAAQADSRTLVLFTKARCLHDRVGTSVKHGNETKITTRVIPLVGSEWTPDQPVPAWIAGFDKAPYGTSWEEICPQEPNDLFIEALLAPGEGGLGQRGQAARSAMSEHGLEQVADAPHYVFAPSPKQVRAKLTLGRFVALLLVGCWLLHLAIAAFKSRKASS